MNNEPDRVGLEHCGPCPHNGDWAQAWAEVKRLRDELSVSKRLHAAKCDQHMASESERLRLENEQLRANVASAQSCPSCGGLLPDHAPECGRYPLVVAELRAEVARLRGLMAEAVRDFQGRAVFFSARFLNEADKAQEG